MLIKDCEDEKTGPGVDGNVRMIPDGASSSSASSVSSVNLDMNHSVDSVADVGKSRQELTIGTAEQHHPR